MCGAKTLLIVFNVLFWIAGGTLLGFGVWMLVDPMMINNFKIVSLANSDEDPLVTYAAIIFIVVGTVAFLVGFLGFCGAHTENQNMLGAYAILLILIMAIEIIAATLVIVYQKRVSSALQKGLLFKLEKEYVPNHDATTTAWDAFQRRMKCCGVVSYKDFTNSTWANITRWSLQKGDVVEAVPESCCAMTTDGSAESNDKILKECQQHAKTGVTKSESLYTEGCFTALQSWLVTQTTVMIILAFVVAALEMFGIMAACFLRAAIGKQSGKVVEE